MIFVLSMMFSSGLPEGGAGLTPAIRSYGRSQDIVTESGSFDVSAFVPLLRERLYARGACARQFAAAWVSALDALPALPLLPHLRDLLDPMLHMLDEPHPEIRRMSVS